MALNYSQDILSTGDKVTIIITQQYAQEQNGGEKAQRYLSAIYDVKKDGTLVMDIPVIQRRLVALSTGLRYTFIFTTEDRNHDKSFYISEGEITSRYRQGNFFLMDARLSTPLNRFQRREYYRLECSLKSIGVALGDDFDPKQIIDAGKFLIEHIRDGYQVAHGTISNISGGGALLITNEDFKDASYILMRVIFSNEEDEKKSNAEDDTMELLAKILEKRYNEETKKYSYRLMFVFQNPRFRDRIIKYVFDEQRRQRKKEQES
jgi:c-di-GMP-binding flagellar brake protein YcgR